MVIPLIISNTSFSGPLQCSKDALKSPHIKYNDGSWFGSSISSFLSLAGTCFNTAYQCVLEEALGRHASCSFFARDNVTVEASFFEVLEGLSMLCQPFVVDFESLD